jgi:RNA polymerase sigma-70 factor (ECF subfamily)
MNQERTVAGLSAVGAQIETAPSLLELARDGDADAFDEVYRIYTTRLLRHAMALCGNATLAEELAQDTLVDAWKCLRRYNGRCEFFTWLCAILLNRFRKSIRDKRVRSGSNIGELEVVQNLADHGCSPDEAAALGEQSVLVRQCIDLLPAKHQQVIYLRFYVDSSLEGIALALGCSVGTVKSRLFHALEKLRAMNAMNVEFATLKTKGL